MLTLPGKEAIAPKQPLLASHVAAVVMPDMTRREER